MVVILDLQVQAFGVGGWVGLAAGAIGQTLVDGGEQMPPFAGVLDGEQMRDVSAYVIEVLLADD